MTVVLMKVKGQTLGEINGLVEAFQRANPDVEVFYDIATNCIVCDRPKRVGA